VLRLTPTALVVGARTTHYTHGWLLTAGWRPWGFILVITDASRPAHRQLLATRSWTPNLGYVATNFEWPFCEPRKPSQMLAKIRAAAPNDDAVWDGADDAEGAL